jgi:hypothetical protein
MAGECTVGRELEVGVLLRQESYERIASQLSENESGAFLL